MKHVFIIGSRGLPASYGGFETFVQELVTRRQSDAITYHVACLSDTSHETHHSFEGVDCFSIRPPKLGPARVIAYDAMAISYALRYVKKHQIEAPIFYVLGNTLGAFIRPYLRKIHQAGGQLWINPDGLEWKRSKWSKPVQAYLKYAEKVMCQRSDLVISDNEGIAQYVTRTYPKAKTRFIAYGTDLTPSSLESKDQTVRGWFSKHEVTEGNYYLIVGRFVPENNYETIIREFMASDTQKDLVIICNHEGNDYFETLKKETGFEMDQRIKFVGTVYDRELLAYIRQHASAYIHGHEVGGTNPGLLEALGQTDLNLVLGVDFNQTVAADTALYWTKEKDSLRRLIETVETGQFPEDLGKRAKERMNTEYSWEKIVTQYEELFSNEG